MKIYFLIISILFVILMSCAAKKQVAQPPEEAPAKEPQPQIIERDASRILIIYYDKKIGNAALLEAVEKYGAKIVYRYNALHGLSIQLPADKSVDSAIIYFKKVKGVTSVHRNRIYKLDKPVTH